MKPHTIIEYNLLLKAQSQMIGDGLYISALEIARYHHERWDGNGYPDNLSGEDIPLSARIMSIVDVFDALIAKRPYKDNISYRNSIEIIKKGSGCQFDPKIVAIFRNLPISL